MAAMALLLFKQVLIILISTGIPMAIGLMYHRKNRHERTRDVGEARNDDVSE